MIAEYIVGSYVESAPGALEWVWGGLVSVDMRQVAAAREIAADETQFYFTSGGFMRVKVAHADFVRDWKRATGMA